MAEGLVPGEVGRALAASQHTIVLSAELERRHVCGLGVDPRERRRVGRAGFIEFAATDGVLLANGQRFYIKGVNWCGSEGRAAVGRVR